MSPVLDTLSNRRNRKYTAKEQLRRVLWVIILPVFKMIPRPFFKARCFLLKLLGAKVGKDVHIYGSAVIYFPWNLSIGNFSSIGENALIYNLGPVSIGEHTTISQRAHLCAGTHDYTRADMPLEKLPIKVGNYAWICADAFIGPNVTVHDGAIIAARAVIVKNVEPWSIVGGNPARLIKRRELLS